MTASPTTCSHMRGPVLTLLRVFALSSAPAATLAQNHTSRVPLLRTTPDEWTVNVMKFGARGDGVADDQPAITRAVGKLTALGKGMLYFPPGVYRCGRQARYRDGVFFDGVSDVSIVFEPGAVLLMDNLNPKDGRGDRGHAIRFRGPCASISVVNAVVKWKHKPSTRSLGDGFRFEGYPTDKKSIANIRFINCGAVQCPQTGAVFMGCSDIVVRDFAVTDNLADGLHFNACRRINVNGLTAVNTGDDALAFVTYYDFEHPENIFTAGNPNSGGPYNQPTLGDWNNTHSNATNIIVYGGGANGVRFAGAYHINLSNVTVDGKTCAVTSDCGRRQLPRFGWGYLASRCINISNLTARHSAVAFFVWNFNMSFADDPKWWRFDINAENVIAEDCRDDSVHLWRCAGVTLRGVKALDRRIRIHDVMDCSLDDIDLRNGQLFIQGEPTPPPRRAGMRWANVHLGRTAIRRGSVRIENIRGLTVDRLFVEKSNREALSLSTVRSTEIGSVSAVGFNAEGKDGVCAVVGSDCGNVHIGVLRLPGLPASAILVAGKGPAHETGLSLGRVIGSAPQ